LKAYAFTSANDFLKSRRVYDSACLILDVRMPPMGGLELQDELLRRGVDIPTIFISAHGGRAVLDRVKSGKALGFLEKPFEAHAIERLLRIALKIDP
jgi:two-component system, LuxR family, response regulator FixJ